MNKSYIVNFLALLVTLFGYFFQNILVFNIGIFAFSGAVTNTIAVHMLFEKVPLFYGSGVVENRFEEFKSAIYNLLMNEFFTQANLKRFFQDELSKNEQKFDFRDILERVDYTKAYDSLKQSVNESKFGSMLQMFGGDVALEPLKEPFLEKLKGVMIEISNDKDFQNIVKNSFSNSNINSELYEKISLIVTKRLDELTPKIVKQIVQKMIKEHLGWLVVWGGVFGGLIGYISTLLLKS